MKKNQVVLDIECYSNYFLVMFVNAEGKSKHFELYDNHPLDIYGIKKILNVAEVITFNGLGYDMPMLTLALSGADNETLKMASDSIIVEELRRWHFYKRYKLKEPSWNHIDIIEPAPAVRISLKLYAGRMHSKRMQDLPIEPHELISSEQRQIVIPYCRNDLNNTIDLAHAIEDRIELRRKMGLEYGIDLRSKSDAQIAEAVIKQEVEKLTGEKVKKLSTSTQVFRYQKPPMIKFASEQLQNVLAFFEGVNFTAAANGVISIEDEPPVVKIGNTTYTLGMGGLHSTEHETFHKANDEYTLWDWDAAAFYPNIILQLGLFPESLGEHFLTVFRGITERRLAAKLVKDKLTDSSMKIMINGTFGKLGSAFSILYAPNLLIQTTVTGQLVLLMLIEAFEKNGISVVSANTDGIVMRCPVGKEDSHMKAIIKSFEKHTGFSMESTCYSAVYSRDVNSYIAIKTNGDVKTKGVFATGGLSKSPASEICSKAVVAYLKDGTPIEDTVNNCTDIRDFLTIRTVKGGAVKGATPVYSDVFELDSKGKPKQVLDRMEGGQYLGKAIRWYYAVGMEGVIQYKSNGNTVPKSEGAMPCMDLPEKFPMDIDYDYYIREANDMLMDVGLVKRPKPEKIPRKNCKAWLQLVADGYLVTTDGENYSWYC